MDVSIIGKNITLYTRQKLQRWVNSQGISGNITLKTWSNLAKTFGQL